MRRESANVRVFPPFPALVWTGKMAGMDEAERQALSHVGRTIAYKYRLLGLLAARGIAAVYEAEHVFTKRRVALKRLHRALATEDVERVLREMRAPSTIGHPGIVQVLDGGAEPDGSLYWVRELLQGVSMQEALDRGTLDVAAILQIGIELLEALEAAHAHGFLHGDIQPDNIYLARDERGSVSVKLLDFGIAALEGRPQYPSPERVQGAGVDARSDVWAVGATLYRALSGRAPYQAETYEALRAAIVTREHAPLATLRPELPGSLLAAVERALRKIPNERFATAAQMCGALKALQPSAAGEPDVSSSQLQPPPAAPPQRPKPAATPLPRPAQPRAAVPVVAVALVALAGTACALGIFALRRSQVRQAAAQLTAAPAQQHAEPRPDRPSVAAKPPEQTVAPEPPLEAAEDDAPRTMLASAARPPAQGLRPEALARALAEREPGLQRCLHDAALAKRVAGESLDMLRLEVELAVAPSGDVEHVALRGDAPEELTSCLHARLSEAEFPRAESPSTFRYPLLLRTGGVGQ